MPCLRGMGFELCARYIKHYTTTTSPPGIMVNYKLFEANTWCVVMDISAPTAVHV